MKRFLNSRILICSLAVTVVLGFFAALTVAERVAEAIDAPLLQLMAYDEDRPGGRPGQGPRRGARRWLGGGG